jgi:hypothetical protein
MRRAEPTSTPAVPDVAPDCASALRMGRGLDRGAPDGGPAPTQVFPSLLFPDESVVLDDRTEVTPAQAVENKLTALLK